MKRHASALTRWSMLLWLVLGCVVAHSPVRAQSDSQDYKTAPPAEELDARAEGYVLRRRVMALILIGGTLAGGIIGSVSRRRERARARRQAAGERARDEDSA